jgi:hypothetical protein
MAAPMSEYVAVPIEEEPPALQIRVADPAENRVGERTILCMIYTFYGLLWIALIGAVIWGFVWIFSKN